MQCFPRTGSRDDLASSLTRVAGSAPVTQLGRRSAEVVTTASEPAGVRAGVFALSVPQALVSDLVIDTRVRDIRVRVRWARTNPAWAQVEQPRLNPAQPTVERHRRLEHIDRVGRVAPVL